MAEQFSTPQQVTTAASVPTAENEGNSYRITEILEVFLHNWKWFVLSIGLCLAIAYVKVQRTVPVYTRSAQIMIKEEGNRGAVSGKVDWFASLGIGSPGVNVQNELVAIQSPSMLLEVVKRLGLNTSYTTDSKWHEESLYGNTLPVVVEFLDFDNDSRGALDIELKRNGHFSLSNFSATDSKTTAAIEGNINDTINTPLGKVRVAATPAYANFGKDSQLIHVRRTDVESASKSIAGGLSAQLNNKENSIIDLVYADYNTERAEDVLITLIDAYNDSWIEDKNKTAKATSEFIEERLEVIQRELQDVDNAISDYKSDNLVPDPTTMAGLYVTNANADDKKIVELNNQLYMSKYIKDFITNEKNKLNVLPASTGLGGGGVDGMITNYNTMLLDRNRIAENSSEQSSLVKDADAQLKQMRAAIIAGIDNQINLLETELRSTQKTQQENKSGIANAPQQTKYLVNVERQLKVKEALYVFLLQKREETELSQAFTAYNTRIIKSPMGSNSPVSPQPTRTYLIALAIGLAIPAAILYLLMISNSTVRGRKDIEHLSIPFIGEIPLVGHRKNSFARLLEKFHLKKRKTEVETSREIVIKAHSRNIINEAFRVIRTNLDFINTEETESGQIIMITSANPGSGKTYIAANLATSFALKGKRALVVDLDLRRASASLYVGKPKKGVSAYLSGKEDDWRSLIQPIAGQEDVFVLPVGTIPPNPAELLSGARTQMLLDELRQEYDLIFIDCPPVDIVADASIIAKYADQTIFVVRVELMERDMLPVIESYYTQGRFKNMSLLLNGSLGAYSRYGYHRYGYRYGYGYGYGHGHGKTYGEGYTHED